MWEVVNQPNEKLIIEKRKKKKNQIFMLQESLFKNNN